MTGGILPGENYGLCPICGEPMVTDGNGDIDLHTWVVDGVADVHAECCVRTGCPDSPIIDMVRRADLHTVLTLVAEVVVDITDVERQALNRLAAASEWDMP